jgi:transposase
MFDAILYIATTGCQWRMLPNDFPPVSTARGYFHMQRDNQDENAGLVDRREGVARVESRQSRVAPAMGGSDGRDRLG